MLFREIGGKAIQIVGAQMHVRPLAPQQSRKG
jgi:hypothetical protein